MHVIEHEQNQEFASFGEEFVPFIAKNQFKKALRKHASRPKKDSLADKIQQIMHPTQTKITKDFVKVHIHIIPKTEQSFFFLPKMEDAKFYVYLN